MNGLEKMNEDFLKANSNSLEHVHEYIKIRQTMFGDKDSGKFETIATTALGQDSMIHTKVYASINTHKRLLKAGAKGDTFKAKAKDTFKYCEYFKNQ